MTTVSVAWDKPLTSLVVGDVVRATIRVNGYPLTGGTVQWAEDKLGIVKCDPVVGAHADGQVAQLTAISEGMVDLFCIVNGVFSPEMTANVSKAPVVTPFSAPALAWTPHREHISVGHTDFNYNWDQSHDWQGTDPTPMEIDYANKYDFTISGSPYRQARLKKANPNIRCIPYAELLSTLTNASSTPNIATGFCNDFDAWNAKHSVSAAEAEKGWLHYMGYTDAAHRLTRHADTNSARFYPDPTNQNMRDYSVDRLKRCCAQPYQDGVFLDEYGSGMNRADFALSCTLNGITDQVRLQALCDAETSLLAAASAAMYPKQLVINTGGYLFAWDAQETRAARGAHMEQANDPMSLDWWNSVWPYVDVRLKDQSFVEMVPLREYGGYEKLVDSAGNHMDSLRGKLLELGAYYMCVQDKQQQLGFAFENGNWNTTTPTKNWMPQIDVKIGKPIEPRQRSLTGRWFTRRFSQGLVVVNPIVDRLPPNYATQTIVQLPTDRKYAQVRADGTVGLPVTSVTLRRPEAAIFKVVT